MAGMLPGVESARRRRLHGSNGGCDSSSVISFGFGSSRIRPSHDTHLAPTSFLQVNQSEENEKLGGAAREAKERLNERLRGHLTQEITRHNSQEKLCSVRRRPRRMAMENLQIRSKKNGLNWGKKLLRWKSSDEDECAICLDEFKASEKIAHLRCGHHFHSDCLVPWLENTPHCPCCRATVLCSS